MKVCFLIDDPSPVGGGPEHIRQVAKILEEKYHYRIDVVTPLTVNPKFNLHNFLHRILFSLYTFYFLLSTNYDIYQSHSFSTSLFLPLAKLRGKKVGLTVHGRGVNLISGGLLNRIGLFKFLMWLVLDVWPYDFRLSASKLPGYTQVGNGVDTQEFDKEKSKPDSRYFTVLCVARRDPVKGIEILEKAVKIVQKKYPLVRLNLVSGRPRTAKDFKTANLYVLPSLSEGFPIVLLEAMAAKLPIIATDVGDCRELIEKGKCGFVVKPGSPEELSRSITQMIKLRANKRVQLGENGYRFAKGHYSWDNVARSYDQAYRSI